MNALRKKYEAHMTEKVTIIENNDVVIQIQKEAYEEIIKDFEALKVEHEKVLKECEELNSLSIAPKLSRKPDEEVIVTKAGRRKKSVSGLKNKEKEILEAKCGMKNCVNDNEAMIKCNACGVWTCECCSDAPITKMKPMMDKCPTIFFACKCCADTMLHSTGKQKHSPSKEKLIRDGEKNDNTELLSKIDCLFDKKFEQIKSDMKQLEEKFNSKVTAIDLTYSDAGDDEIVPGTSYAKSLGNSNKHIVNAMREAKNIEKVEKSEFEKRAKNFIIHGADEVGTDAQEVKREDIKYVGGILARLGVTENPESILRLGTPNDNKKRPIKVVLASSDGKKKAMNNLSRLKGTEDDFGRISITDDYTETEREEIKSWVEKAKGMSEKDEQNVYKVRGTPKNGLKIIRFPKKR